jgi:hypothetical protein
MDDSGPPRVDAAEATLWPFVGEGVIPPVYRGVAYLPGPRPGTVRAVRVHVLDDGEDGRCG